MNDQEDAALREKMGKRLIYLRVIHDLRQVDVAVELGVDDSRYARWEHATPKNFSVLDLNKLSKFYGLPLEYFVEGDKRRVPGNVLKKMRDAETADPDA